MVSLAPPQSANAPTAELVEDIILSARYGELEEIQEFVKSYGVDPLAGARDERGNGCLHMAAANGHDDVVSYLLPLLPAESLADVNNAGNTPLHWAALNGHLSTLRLLVPALPKSALFLQNQFGRTPLSEAESNAPAGEAETAAGSSRQLECAGYLLGFMELEAMRQEKEEKGETPQAGGSEQKGDDEEEEVIVGVAKMGVAASNGGFEFVEHKPDEKKEASN